MRVKIIKIQHILLPSTQNVNVIVTSNHLGFEERFLPLHLPLNKTQLRYSRGRTPNFSRKRVSTRASRTSENCPADLGKSREKRKICIQAVHARESIFLNFHEIRAILRQLTSGRRHISLCYVDICLLRVVVSYSPKHFTLSKFDSESSADTNSNTQKY